MQQIPLTIRQSLAKLVQDPTTQQVLMMDNQDLATWLDNQAEQMAQAGITETVQLAYQKVMLQVAETEAINNLLLVEDAVSLQQILQPLTASEATFLMSKDHLMDENEINQLFNLLKILEQN